MEYEELFYKDEAEIENFADLMDHYTGLQELKEMIELKILKCEKKAEEFKKEVDEFFEASGIKR